MEKWSFIKEALFLFLSSPTTAIRLRLMRRKALSGQRVTPPVHLPIILSTDLPKHAAWYSNLNRLPEKMPLTMRSVFWMQWLRAHIPNGVSYMTSVTAVFVLRPLGFQRSKKSHFLLSVLP